MAFFVYSPLEEILSLTTYTCCPAASLLWFSIFVHVTNSFTSGSDNEVDNILPKEEQKRVPLEGIPHLRELEHNLFLWAAQAWGVQTSHRFHLNNSLQFRFF